MKNILFFSTAYFPFIGGAEVAVKELTDRLGKIKVNGENKYRFDMITSRLDPKLPEMEKIGSINVYRIGFGRKTDKFLLPVLGLIKAIQLNKKNKYALIWTVMASQAAVAASFFKSLNPDIKMLLNLQEGDEEEHLARYVGGSKFLFNLFIKPWHRLPIKKADFITAISRYLRDRAIVSGAKCEIDIIPNGVDVNKFGIRNSEFGLDELKNKLNLKNNEKIVITVSRLVKKNGVGDLIQAMKFLDSDCRLLIIGTGEDEFALKELAKESGQENKIIFLGRMEQDKIPRYLWMSDVFVRPSLSEGLGNVFLEAMAAGLPVIGTPVGGIPDFLINGETGLFCKVSDPASIAEKIKLLIGDNGLREKIKNNGLKLVEEKYNWNNISADMEKVLTGIIAT